MTIKTITYKRILNLGNYESKHLELSCEVDEYDDPEIEMSRLMELVERKIREEADNKIEQELAAGRKLLREVKAEYEHIKNSIKESLHPTPDHPDSEEPDPDDIPFDHQVTEGGDF
ncbi:hypothetical protein H6G54_00745 [Anabaena cylindrica FACHB-243]|uniref:Uncharacterized protein n=1 Tax=Anabaena cylindrica (strain ATCC 27899 / PCC 7122) TaxID=272123 RepID=K9ZLI0_ANACC|nr:MULTISPECIES: hypothetical protein [Anabaena]AFZ59392.1 hypothetical protein Anacy_4022 [Anabaena cylindrica PCC 7122]MBD2416264.1 hypothetical protein [Anabaena cylindrica FACHB-243]MBY5280227.1 hypothetical protein [Anabaena sp. CCAP 1446/1C]MBY5308499.1 hypothetical protein [Anabaena sp. CCAP 1446/1C]MCM2405310.1 hypothetical protein [Anabaena sp. CCAP 1446/1C]